MTKDDKQQLDRLCDISVAMGKLEIACPELRATARALRLVAGSRIREIERSIREENKKRRGRRPVTVKESK